MNTKDNKLIWESIQESNPRVGAPDTIPAASGAQHPDPDVIDKMPGEIGQDQNAYSNEGYEEMSVEELAGLSLSDKIEALTSMTRSAPMDEQDEYELNRTLFSALEMLHDTFLRHSPNGNF